ncbi:MAG TPA: hypothetical protein VG458_09805, partial [Solirubrobacterales bacterium]|nr:hypothetical protein [Solirubrobacterales bacterium]
MAHPRSWPVRWRLAAVSAGLTLLILVVVGGAIGQITTQRIRDDFNAEVRGAAQILSSKLRIVYPFFSEPQLQTTPQLESFVLPDDASVRIYNVNKDPRGGAGGADLGPLEEGITDYEGYRVATAPILDEAGQIGGYVQYGRSLD